MSAKRFEGKNLEEAIDSAARSFGVESFRVSYHVVLEKRGFLGGTKRVVIEAEVSGSAPAEAKKPAKEREKKPERSGRSDRPAPAAARPHKNDRPDERERPAKRERPDKRERPSRSERPARAETTQKSEASPDQAGSLWQFEEPSGENTAPTRESRKREEVSQPDTSEDRSRPEQDQQKPSVRSSRRRGRRGRGGRGRSAGESNGGPERPPAEPRAAESSEPVEIPDQGEQSSEAASVAAWCETIFRISGLDLVARTKDLEEEIAVELFGHDAVTVQETTDYLDSLQVLANKAFTGRSIERRIELDAAGFKRRREEDLAERAREVADRVREEGRERTMRAMSPIERRIVHVTLQEESGVTTESRGRGFHKRVVILPAEEEQPAAGES